MYHKAIALTIAVGLAMAISGYIWFNACVYIAIAAHGLYPDSLYAIAAHDGGEFNHAYLIVNGTPKDPQLLFLGLSSHVDYENPIYTTNSTTEMYKKGFKFAQI